MQKRPRRNRKSPIIRELVRETYLRPANFISPFFLLENAGQESIPSLPGIHRMGLDLAKVEMEKQMNLGINSFVLFPVISEDKKTTDAAYGISEENFYYRHIQELKSTFPEAIFMSDVALDPYNSDGHDGLVQNGVILNDETLPILSTMAVMQAEAGIDIIGPSDMMDGRVGEIRTALDEAQFTDVSIMSYTAKYASAFYGPFRDALDSAPKAGDKKTYQMDHRNSREAFIEAELDLAEGADFLMVKPALSYLDIIAQLAQNFDTPIAAYNVSGEYAMLHAAAEKGWLNLEQCMVETLESIHRAGAQIILSYFAKDFAKWYFKNN